MCGQHGHDTQPRPIATQFPGHECMDRLTTERRFYSQATCTLVIDVLWLTFWTCYRLVFVQPGTSRRLVEGHNNQMSVVYCIAL